MNEITVASDETGVNSEISTLFERAKTELPHDITDELEAEAWIAKRIIEISETQRRQKQTIQVLLASWINNNIHGPVWANHPNHYESLREFLNDVGTEEEGNTLTPSVISEIISVSEIIVPYCSAHNIPINGFIVSGLWTKLRETISYIRALVEDDEPEAIKAVLEDVRAFPRREALREKYRRNREGKIGLSDAIIMAGIGKAVVVTVVPLSELTTIRRALGRYTEWTSFTASKKLSESTIEIKVKHEL